jgi:hypothetical protein
MANKDLAFAAALGLSAVMDARSTLKALRDAKAIQINPGHKHVFSQAVCCFVPGQNCMGGPGVHGRPEVSKAVWPYKAL